MNVYVVTESSKDKQICWDTTNDVAAVIGYMATRQEERCLLQCDGSAESECHACVASTESAITH